MTFFQNHNIFEVATPNKLALQGLFMDSLDSDTFVNYDLSKLNLSDAFSIEIRVRGAALKRTSGFYILANGVGGQNSTFRLQLNNGELFVANGTNFTNWIKIHENELESNITDNNAFYKVRYEKENNTNYRLTLLKDNTVLISKPRAIGVPPVLPPGGVLWVGG